MKLQSCNTADTFNRDQHLIDCSDSIYIKKKEAWSILEQNE